MSPILPPVAQHDRKFFVAVAAATIVLGLLPLLLGATWLRRGEAFMGFNTFAPSDTNVYYSMMEQAARTGHTFFTNVFTAEPHAPAFFEPLWGMLGYASAVFHLPHVATFTIAKVLAAVLFLWALARVVGMFCSTSLHRRVAFTLIALGMGVGAYVVPGLKLDTVGDLLTKNPVDLWVSEGFTFSTLMHSPLFILSQLFLLLTFAFVIRDEQEPGIVPHAVFAGLAALLAVLHPYDLPTIFLVLGGFFVVRYLRDRSIARAALRRALTRLIIMGGVAVGVGAYFVVVYRISPEIGGWAKQNITLSPPLWNYAVGYGFLLVFALLGWVQQRKNRDLAVTFLLTWLPMQVALLYLPSQIQRRFTNGLHVVVALLASFAVVRAWQWVTRQRTPEWKTFVLRSAVLWVAPLLFFYSTAYVVVRDIVRWNRHTPEEWSVYIQPHSTLEAMDWLQTQPRGTTLAAVATGYIFSGRTLLPAYLAHGHQTVRYVEKGARLVAAFDGEGLGVEAFLRSERIRYVLWTSNERDTFAPFDPSTKPYLTLVHKTATAAVYAVQGVE